MYKVPVLRHLGLANGKEHFTKAINQIFHHVLLMHFILYIYPSIAG